MSIKVNGIPVANIGITKQEADARYAKKSSTSDLGDITYYLEEITNLVSCYFKENSITIPQGDTGTLTVKVSFDQSLVNNGLVLIKFLMPDFLITRTIVMWPSGGLQEFYINIQISGESTIDTSILDFSYTAHKVYQTPVSLADVNVATKEELANAINGSWEESY